MIKIRLKTEVVLGKKLNKDFKERVGFIGSASWFDFSCCSVSLVVETFIEILY